ncbi:GSCOCG00012816001-RA-CDS [Cotesia congregata]|nr:GSCOCG00012816001-RA-CDS [Cotesia congregata]
MKSTFFVIGKANKFCRDSAVILEEMWKFELLSSFVVCSKTNNQTMLYTYNPYTNRATDSWVAVRNKENSKRRWTLYKKAFINDPKICKTLKFDKTQFMDRYPVKIITGIHGQIGSLRPVFRSLNMQVKVHPHDECCGHQTNAGFLILGDEDIAAGFYHIDVFNKDVNIIPVLYEFHYIIITQKRSFTYSFREVIAMLDYRTLFAIKSIISLIFIVIVVNNRYHVGSAFLDVFKLLLSMDMDTPFVRLSMMFLFFTATFFMFVFEPAIESQLFALLTRPQSYTIENLKDLHDHQYHVYFYKGIRKDFINERLWTTVEDMKYLHPLDKNNPDDCLELASKNNTVACVYTSHIILETALNKILHVSSKFVFIKNNFVWSRKDWALNDRVYERILNTVESGFNDKFDRDWERNVLKTIKAKNRINQLDDYDEITEANLYYAYIAFMICQIIGICTFIVERLIARFRR